MSEELPLFKQVQFDGHSYEPKHDEKRLTGQLGKVFNLMRDGHWRTLAEIQSVTGGSQAGLSARLRDLRKERFGSFEVERRRRGDPKSGLFEYHILGAKYEN